MVFAIIFLEIISIVILFIVIDFTEKNGIGTESYSVVESLVVSAKVLLGISLFTLFVFGFVLLVMVPS
jgi:hypothetical protein